jgi:hypothetical protein
MKYRMFTLLAMVLLVSGLAACSPPSSQPLPKSMKGYELYSWQESGQWHFTLITGTNRDKTLEEITTGNDQMTDDGWVDLHTTGVDELKNIIARVPAGTFVSWADGRFVMKPDNTDFKFEFPPQDVIDEIKAVALQYGIDFNTY